MTDSERQEKGTDRVVLDLDEAVEIADNLEMFYEYTKEDSYQTTAVDVARQAEMIRDRIPDDHEPYADEGWK